MEKTCENCWHADPYMLACGICEKSRKFSVHPDEYACEYWEEDADTIEQRYEQLEQVAKEMYQVIDEAMNREQYVCNLGDSERMKSSLKALGVEV